MKTLILAAIRCSLMFTAVAALSVQPAQAYKVTLEEVGFNVVANGSGAFNLMGLSLLHTNQGNFSSIRAASGSIVTGQFVGFSSDEYVGFTGPPSFGTGDRFFADASSGDSVGFFGLTRFFFVPDGYVSGSALSSSATWVNATFTSLGVTPGTYKWTWGTGLPNQNFTLQIGPATVPDGGSTVSLLGFGLLGLAALRRKLGW